MDWAGGLAEVEFTSGGQTYWLRYFHSNSGSYSGEPADSADGTVAYVVGDAFPGNGTWINAAHDLAADIDAEFGIDEFTAQAVRIGSLQERTDTFPFSNMTTYWDDVRLAGGDGNTNPPPDPGYTLISEIQGDGGFSPLAGQTVTIEGVDVGIDDEVGADFSRSYPEDRGIFVQSLADDVDDNAATSEGVFVGYVDEPVEYELGDVVRVTGEAKEKFGLTMIAEQIGQEPERIDTTDVPEPVVLDQTEADA